MESFTGPGALDASAPPVPDNKPWAASASIAADIGDILPVRSESEEHAALTVNALLYEAQLDLIAHKSSDAAQKLELAIERGSSAACATLGNLIARGWRARPSEDTCCRSSPGTGDAGPDPIQGRSPRTRPGMPGRTSSASSVASRRQTPSNALRATRLFIRGLEVELKKSAGACSYDRGFEEDSDSDIEGSAFDLDRALDLLTGLADSHRFGILHAPRTGDSDLVLDSETLNDELWSASARLCEAILRHEDVAAALSGENGRDSAATVSSHEPKQRSAVAVSALYILALQAWAIPTAPASQWLPPSPASESKTTARRYWTAIDAIATPFAADGGLGSRAADELVARARHRLTSLQRGNLGAEEPWRLAKKRNKTVGKSPPQSHETTLWPASPPELMLSCGAALELASPPRFSSSPRERRALAAARSRSDELVQQSTRSDAEQKPRAMPPAATGLPGAISYPSPPISLTSEEEYLMTRPTRRPAPLKLDSGALREAQREPARQDEAPPECADHPRPLDAPHLAVSPIVEDLRRSTSLRSLGSTFSTTSALSDFRHNPLERYAVERLRRVSSSTSVCTAPPLFVKVGSRGPKGKARLVEDHGLPAADRPRASMEDSLSSLESDSSRSRSWLSRFWRQSRRTGQPSSIDSFDERARRTSTRSHTALDQLRGALERHECAYESALDYWGETEFVEDDEDEEALEIVAEEDPRRYGSERHVDQGARSMSQADTLRASLAAGVAAGTSGTERSRAQSGHRSFAQSDPTRHSTLAPDSAVTSEGRRRHRHPSGFGSSRASSPEPDHHRSRRRTRPSRKPVDPAAIKAIPIDPLFLELERHSRFGKQTVCAVCGKKRPNFPICRTCRQSFCCSECRTSDRHALHDEAAKRKQVDEQDRPRSGDQ